MPPQNESFEPSILTGVSSFVYLEVLTASKHFAAAGKQTRKWFLSGMYSDVVDKLVLGLERPQTTAAVQPQTDVDALVRRSDVFQTDMGDQIVHGVERSATAGPGVHPPTRHLLLDGGRRSKVAE